MADNLITERQGDKIIDLLQEVVFRLKALDENLDRIHDELWEIKGSTESISSLVDETRGYVEEIKDKE